MCSSRSMERPWQSVRPGVEVKVLPQENELYVFAQSHDRLKKERAMRRRQLKALWKRLGQLHLTWTVYWRATETVTRSPHFCG
jgi:hypothetical protein